MFFALTKGYLLNTSVGFCEITETPVSTNLDHRPCAFFETRDVMTNCLLEYICFTLILINI